MSDFDAFWSLYPRKVGKLDAMKAYEKARRLASAEDILAGVHQYRLHLPEEMRYVAHPATWLNAGRWFDEYERPVVQRVHWYDECQELHGGTCDKQWNHELKKRA